MHPTEPEKCMLMRRQIVALNMSEDRIARQSNTLTSIFINIKIMEKVSKSAWLLLNHAVGHIGLLLLYLASPS